MTEPVKLPRVAKGKKPVYLDERAIDNLASALVALTQEVSVMRDRLDTVERLIEQHQLFTQADIEAFKPGAEAGEARSALRRAYLERVFKYVNEELDRLERYPKDPDRSFIR